MALYMKFKSHLKTYFFGHKFALGFFVQNTAQLFNTKMMSRLYMIYPMIYLI